MTVLTNVNKTSPMVMGTSNYNFTFRCLTEDPTSENAKQAIRAKITDGEHETELVYGTDYTVTLNANGVGGHITVTDPKTEDFKIIVYRDYSLRQESDYEDFNSFPANTLEGNLDKLTMILQQLKEEIDRSVKVSMLSEDTPAEMFTEFLERVNDLIEQGEELIEQTEAIKDEAQAARDEAEQYANDVKFGLYREMFSASDWQGTQYRQRIFFPDVGIITAVYKDTGDDTYKQVINADITTDDTGTTISIPGNAGFDGYILRAESKHTEYTHYQQVAASVWNIEHNLGCHPGYVLTDDDGYEITGQVQYIDLNNIQITFTEAQTGKVYLI